MSRPLLALVREELQEQVGSELGDPVLAGFAGWLGVAEAPPHAPTGGVRNYQAVAADALTAIRGGDAAAFESGMAWLVERRFFNLANRGGWGLEGDPVAVLALALGARRLAVASPHRGWIVAFAGRALEHESDAWRRSLLHAARSLLGDAEWRHVESDLVVALEAKGAAVSDEAVRRQATTLVLARGRRDPPERAIVRLAALTRLLAMDGAIDVRQTSREDVVRLLRAVPDALKRWPWKSARKGTPAEMTWDFASEYDVQAFLFAMLKPVFDDLMDEEYLKSIGYKHPKVDLAIPRLRLIIEVKFLYQATQSKLSGVSEEIAADTGLYLSEDNGYDGIIAFIWDNTGSVHHHGALAAGLRKLNGVVDAVVVGRPGTWKRP